MLYIPTPILSLTLIFHSGPDMETLRALIGDAGSVPAQKYLDIERSARELAAIFNG